MSANFDSATQAPARSRASRAVAGIFRHPMALAFKGAAKDAWWAIKGRGLINPPLPVPVHSILFVCLGNICRSPFAGLRATQRLEAAGVTGIRCASAGISTRQAARVPAEACDVATTAYGLSLSEHRPQLLTRKLADAFDLIVVMEARQLEQLRDAYPHLSTRICLLSLFDPDPVAAYQRYHIEDPFSRPRTAFETCYRRIDRALECFIAGLAAGRPPVRPSQVNACEPL